MTTTTQSPHCHFVSLTLPPLSTCDNNNTVTTLSFCPPDTFPSVNRVTTTTQSSSLPRSQSAPTQATKSDNNNIGAPPGVRSGMSTVTASCPGDVLSSDIDHAVIEEDGDDWSTTDDDYEEIDPNTRQPPEFEYNSDFQVCSCFSILTCLVLMLIRSLLYCYLYQLSSLLFHFHFPYLFPNAVLSAPSRSSTSYFSFYFPGLLNQLFLPHL